jgi:PAS domain S-box-containing protein
MEAESKAGTVTPAIRPGRGSVRIIAGILVCLMLIFVADISTPLGFSVWILYFIPLFLTLYWEEQNGPFSVTGIIVLLIAASFFLSPRDISPVFALLNRVFFSAMLIVSALLIWNHKKSEVELKKSEKNYRILTEWSPEAVVVYRDGAIRYANRAFLHLFDQDPAGTPLGRDILILIPPDQQDLVMERIRQASFGAQGEAPDIILRRPWGRDIRMDLTFREVCWDSSPGVMILGKIAASG